MKIGSDCTYLSLLTTVSFCVLSLCFLFQFRTEKQDNYNFKGPAGVIRASAPASRVLDSAPFEGASVTKTDFPAHSGAKPAPLFRPPPRQTVGDDADTRDFKSESAANYKTLGFSKRAPSIPA